MVPVPSSAATRRMVTATMPSASAIRIAASAISVRLCPGLRPPLAALGQRQIGRSVSVQVPLGIFSAGNGLSGRSLNDGGLVIDVGALNTVEVLDAQSGRVRVGPGARWVDVARTLTRTGWPSPAATTAAWGSTAWPPRAASAGSPASTA
jgi:hypothetical protein